MSEVKVLDCGYVRLIECWGQGEEPSGDFERGIIEAARQSTQGSFRGWEVDEKLLRYLFDNRHDSPFEFAGAVIEVQAPIFVFREWHRHRTQSYNEMSARYAPLPDLHYVPTVERLLMNRDSLNKQAGRVKNAPELTEETAEAYRQALKEHHERFQRLYDAALGMGVPKELARGGMPVDRYSRMRASANLRNWLSFMTLRMHPSAQWEIQQYANVLHDLLREKFPRTIGLFDRAWLERPRA